MRSSVFFLICMIFILQSEGKSCNVIDDICTNSAYCSGSDKKRSSDEFTVEGITYKYRDFNAISFGDFKITKGDVEGRVAAKGSFSGVGGVSIGETLASSSLTYSAIFGEGASFDSEGGRIYPSDSKMFVGNGFNYPADPTLEAQGQDSCGSTPGCLNDQFANMKLYYQQISTSFGSAAPTANGALDTQSGNLHISCNDQSATVNIIQITLSNFVQITTYSIDSNCNSASLYVINIKGNGATTVPFKSREFPTRDVVFNIVDGSPISVTATVLGAILAPNSVFTMTEGYIEGQIIVNDNQNTKQINLPCPTAGTTAAITSAVLTSSELTTSPLTTQELTTSPLTTQELTTSPLTTQELTTSPLTTQELTTSPLTTAELTTSPLTTQEMTSSALTTSEVTSASVTSAAMTTGQLMKCTAGGGGDPVYLGYDGKAFLFKGYEGGIFNIYNDPFININTLFAAARKNGQGTIMASVGLSFEGHQLSIEAKHSNADEWKLNYDGIERRMYKDLSAVILTQDCLTLKWRPHIIELRSPRHFVTIKRSAPNGNHFDFPYLEIRVQHLEEDTDYIGGVIGQTATPGAHRSTKSEDFVSSTLFSADSKKNYFSGRALVCQKSFGDLHSSKRSWTPRLVAPDDCADYQAQVNNCRFKSSGSSCGSFGTCQFDGDSNLVCIDSELGPQGICTGGSNYDCPRAEVCIPSMSNTCYHLYRQLAK